MQPWPHAVRDLVSARFFVTSPAADARRLVALRLDLAGLRRCTHIATRHRMDTRVCLFTSGPLPCLPGRDRLTRGRQGATSSSTRPQSRCRCTKKPRYGLTLTASAAHVWHLSLHRSVTDKVDAWTGVGVTGYVPRSGVIKSCNARSSELSCAQPAETVIIAVLSLVYAVAPM